MLQFDIRSSLSETTAPTAEPVSVADLKKQMSIDHAEDDVWLCEIQKTARQLVEAHVERQLMTATYTMVLDSFPSVIELQRPPVKSVTSLAYIDANGNSQTIVEGVDFTADIISEPARLVPFVGKSWPSTRAVPNAVTVVFVCGEATAGLVPARAKQAIKMLASHWYDNRSAVQVGNFKQIELAYTALLNSMRWRVGV